MQNNENPNSFHRKKKNDQNKKLFSKNTKNKNYQDNIDSSFSMSISDTNHGDNLNYNITTTNSNNSKNENFSENDNYYNKKGGRSKYILQIMNSLENPKPSIFLDSYSKSQSETPIYESNTFKNYPSFSENQEKFTTQYTSLSDLTDNQPKNILIINEPDIAKLDSGHDSDTSEASGDLNKLQLMTAADFNHDRYARFAIHESEMKDYVRTITFKNCIEHCADQYIKNKVVLVIRCGIGLLPMLCVRIGGAKKVIGLEQSACIEYARCIVKDNSYCHKITLIQSSVNELKQLPHGLNEVDVIISDFMGECVLSQGNEMEEVIEARNRFLKSNGLMIPMCVTIYGQLLEHRQAYSNQRIYKTNKKKKYKKLNEYMHKEKLNQSLTKNNDCDSSSDDSTNCSWWKNVYGFDMRSKAQFIVDSNSESEDNNSTREWRVMSEPLVQFFDPCRVVSTPCLIKAFNMYECTINDARYVQCKDLRLKCSTPFTSANGGDYAHMLELFMVVDFPNGQNISHNNDNTEIGFSTSCFSPHTRYRQTGLLLQDQLIVEQNDIFIINDFRMWRGSQNRPYKPYNKNIAKTCLKSRNEENLKLRMRYTFVNRHMKVVDRCCAYTLIKDLY